MKFRCRYIRQYLFESDTDGTRISRIYCSIVYQQSKGDLGSYCEEYDWFSHSMSAQDALNFEYEIRVLVG